MPVEPSKPLPVGKDFLLFYQFALYPISDFHFHLLVLLIHGVSLAPGAVAVSFHILAVATQ